MHRIDGPGATIDNQFTEGDPSISVPAGSASSGATARANADAQNLYTLLWDNISDTYAAVTGGRGASAAADFAAHKPLAHNNMQPSSFLNAMIKL